MMNKNLLYFSLIALAAGTCAQAQTVLLNERWNWDASGSADTAAVIPDHSAWQLDNGCFGSGIYVDAYGTFSWETYLSGLQDEDGNDYSCLEMKGDNTSNSWWAGFSLRTTDTFSASMDQVLVVEAQRNSLIKTGRGRSGLWLMAPDKSKYFIFSDNYGEGGWEYNAYSGLVSDNPVGNGADLGLLAAYNDAAESHGMYKMRIVANGKSVGLYLKSGSEVFDEEGNPIPQPWVYGGTVPLNFSEDITVGLGVYARAPKTDTYEGDYVGATFGPLKVTQYDAAYFGTETINLLENQTSDAFLVKVPASATAGKGIAVTVVTSDSAIANLVGGTDGKLVLNFAAGETEKEFQVVSLDSGSCALSLVVPEGMMASNSASVGVSGSAGVQFEDDFSGGLDLENSWILTDQAFENGTGELDISVTDGVLNATGSCTVRAWSGGGIRSQKAFYATESMPLHITVDRTSLSYTDRGRSGIFLCNEDRTQYAFFNDSPAENGWVYNIPGIAGSDGNTAGKGRGVDISAFGSKSDGGLHQMELFYNGSTIQFYLDGVLGATANWAYTGPIYLELAWFARIEGATIQGGFDNVFVENQIGPGTVSPATVTAIPGISNTVTVSVPAYALIEGDTTVTLTSADPSIAYVEGAVAGSTTLTFEKGGNNSKRINVIATGKAGTTTIAVIPPEDKNWLHFSSEIIVNAFAAPTLLCSEDFSANLNKWKTVERSSGGILDSQEFYIENGELIGYIHSSGGTNGGSTIQLQDHFFPTAEAPVIFECTQKSLGGRGNQFNANVIVVNLDTDAISSLGFAKGDLRGWYLFPSNLTGTGGAPTAFQTDEFSDNGRHTVKLICDGSTVQYFLDGLYGGAYGFAASHITFALGAGVQHANNEAEVNFDDVSIYGTPAILSDKDEVLLENGTTTFNLFSSGFVRTEGTTVTLKIQDTGVASFDSGETKTIALNASSDFSIPVTLYKKGAGTTTVALSNDKGYMMPIETILVSATTSEETLFTDTFPNTSLSTTDWWLDESGFEYSKTPEAGGTLETYSGPGVSLFFTVETNYWGGAAYITTAGFKASVLSPLTFTMRRDYYSYSGSGARCSFLVYEGNGTRWINIADAFGTGNSRIGWCYNRSINETGDNATGNGTVFTSLSTTELLDCQAHDVKIVANGKIIAFYVDDVYGGEIAFPVSEDIHFGFGVYGRAAGDTIEAAFGAVSITGSSSPLPDAPIIITHPRDLTVALGEPAIFTVTAQGEGLSYQWYKGETAIEGAITSTYTIASTTDADAGTYTVGVSNASGTVMSSPATLTVTPAGKLLFMDNFSGVALDPGLWTIDTTGFEASKYPTAGGMFECNTGANGLSAQFTLTENYWGGAILYTADHYVASAENPLTFVVERESFDYSATGARCSFLIRNADGSKWINFAELKDNAPGYVGWAYNRNIGEEGDNNNGIGIKFDTLNSNAALTDKGHHTIKLVANGSTVAFYLDGILGGEVAFPVNEGISFGIGLYARALNDTLSATFLNAKVYGAEAPTPIVAPILSYEMDGTTLILKWAESANAFLTVAPTATGEWTILNPMMIEIVDGVCTYKWDISADSGYFRLVAE